MPDSFAMLDDEFQEKLEAEFGLPIEKVAVKVPVSPRKGSPICYSCARKTDVPNIELWSSSNCQFFCDYCTAPVYSVWPPQEDVDAQIIVRDVNALYPNAPNITVNDMLNWKPVSSKQERRTMALAKAVVFFRDNTVTFLCGFAFATLIQVICLLAH